MLTFTHTKNKQAHNIHPSTSLLYKTRPRQITAYSIVLCPGVQREPQNPKILGYFIWKLDIFFHQSGLKLVNKKNYYNTKTLYFIDNGMKNDAISSYFLKIIDENEKYLTMKTTKAKRIQGSRKCFPYL